jgi:hypothetical protein
MKEREREKGEEEREYIGEIGRYNKRERESGDTKREVVEKERKRKRERERRE